MISDDVYTAIRRRGDANPAGWRLEQYIQHNADTDEEVVQAAKDMRREVDVLLEELSELELTDNESDE